MSMSNASAKYSHALWNVTILSPAYGLNRCHHRLHERHRHALSVLRIAGEVRIPVGVYVALIAPDPAGRHLLKLDSIAHIDPTRLAEIYSGIAGSAQQVVTPRLGIQTAMNEQIRRVQVNHFRGFGHDIVNVLRPPHDRMHLDAVAADLPGDVGVVRRRRNDLELSLRRLREGHE
jgi:hypothetical protein